MCFVCPCNPPEGNIEESARSAVHPNPYMINTHLSIPEVSIQTDLPCHYVSNYENAMHFKT